MNRCLSTLAGSSRKLDGGVMFGNTPRQLWAEWIKPDQDNLVDLASRGLLVQQGGKNILVLAGASALLAPLRRTCSCQKHPPGLLDSLAQQGLTEGDISAVVLTHLHAQLTPELSAAIEEGNTPRLLFPAAHYITGERHWSRALHNHPHDRALFVRQIVRRLQGSGRLVLVDDARCKELGDGWQFHFSDGYTPGQLIPEIAMPGGPVVFAGDLIPGTHWLRLDVTTANDRNPEGLVGEKERLLDHLVASGGRLVFSSDPQIAMIKIMRDRHSRYQAFDTYTTLSRFEC
ncbi:MULTISPECIES: MBL fold metallo-hydrolase [Pseudomonas]|uniref:MBL fold metallo-hydrolase n=1 Tax=Pseudomonas TaxID=286 RepID=UPI00200B97CB|nr:MBL fold metallo-hydrolase [Pseudomonas sp. V98_8]MCK8682866.1 MBL fold metallo-hydrolase [Pseudomonas umsongensis]MDI3393543.1 MBL fold metallo-hydrolase [Pseudomonas sp. V98_8]MDP9687491.1 glyoxylase-like metal-dependent hydrolase (beta-lactamase superfamily II) [Pseudomonas mohnii]